MLNRRPLGLKRGKLSAINLVTSVNLDEVLKHSAARVGASDDAVAKLSAAFEANGVRFTWQL